MTSRKLLADHLQSRAMLGVAHVGHLERTEAFCACMPQQQAEGSDVEHPLEPSELP